MLGYKNRLKKFKKTEIISSIHSNYDIETRNQLQKNWKKQTRPFEGKHHATKEPMSPQRGKNFKKRCNKTKRKWKKNCSKKL